MKKIGLTGGIGSGKSVIARLLEVIGFPVYDSDFHAKQLMQTNSSLRESLVNEFGALVYTDGRLNRQYLSSFVFNEPDRLSMLNQLVHPVVKMDFLAWAESQSSSLVFLESAILFESGFFMLMDNTIMVTAPLALRIDRVMQRDGATKETILRRMENQWAEEKKIALADYMIVNDDQHSLLEQTHQIITELIS